MCILKLPSSYCMSHLKIPRKRLSSPGFKLRSEESREQYIKRSLGKILNENIANRRAITHNNSPNHSSRQLHEELEEAKRVYQSKNTKKALPMFRKLHQQLPAAPQICYYLGSCLLNEGQYEAALHCFKSSLEHGPNKDKNVHIYIAICYKALQNYPAALKALDEAIIYNPRFEEAYFYKGKILTKIKNFIQAAANFKKCITLNPQNELSHIQYADSLRACGKIKQAISRYQKALILDGKSKQIALLKKISLFMDIGSNQEAEKEVRRADILGLGCPEIKYYRGVLEYQKGNLNQASVCLELSLTESQKLSTASKSLRILMQIAISQKDFFGAEHLVNRSIKMGIKDEENSLLCTVIQGINDLIKKKFCQCTSKLIETLEKCAKLKNPKMKIFLTDSIRPYLAYSLFSEDKYKESFAIFQSINNESLDTDPITKFNREICEGIIFHKEQQFSHAQEKFIAASHILPSKIEPIFLNCINIIRLLKDDSSEKQVLFHKLEALLDQGDEIVPPQSLFFFYKSLIYLYQGRDASQVINYAIEKSDQEISEYFYIQGLSYSLNGKTLQGLKSINKAISLDSNIPEFFKERSKYLYVLERYQQAVENILQILGDNDDEEAKLLLTFYFYMSGSYSKSLQVLNQINNSSTGDRFRDFQTAIMFRLGRFQQCGLPGQIISAITTQSKLSEQTIQEINGIIQERCCFAEFSTYHFHLMFAIYYCYNGLFDQCLDHLFGCLEEIQNNFSEQTDYLPLFCEIKFNIVIVNLCKDCERPSSNAQSNPDIQQSYKYIELFMSETDDEDFLACMESILKAIKAPSGMETSIKTQEEEFTKIVLGGAQSKISDYFPEIQIKLPSGFIRTKMMAMYPQKLKFNICPEFDDSFLFNFDMEKVDTKLCPPWYNLCQGEILFTEQIRNQSVLMSETEKSSTPLLVGDGPISLREKFKLDDSVERRLEKLMQRKREV